MVKKYPDLRKRFKVGDRVCTTYRWRGEKPKRYCGTVKKVIKDALDVKMDSSPHGLSRWWDYAVFGGTGGYSSVRKVRKRR